MYPGSPRAGASVPHTSVFTASDLPSPHAIDMFDTLVRTPLAPRSLPGGAGSAGNNPSSSEDEVAMIPAGRKGKGKGQEGEGKPVRKRKGKVIRVLRYATGKGGPGETRS